MAVNPFEQFQQSSGAAGGGYGNSMLPPPTAGGGGGKQQYTGGVPNGSLLPQQGGRSQADMPAPGFSPGTWTSPVQNTGGPAIPPSPWGQQGYSPWRNQMTGFGGSPYTYSQPSSPWMQNQGGPWGMSNRGVNPYMGQNTADPRFQQQGIPGVGGMIGGPFGQGNVNPMWQALQQQRFIPSQNPYAPMQPNPNQNFWLPGMNPYANQQGGGMQGQVPSQWQGIPPRRPYPEYNQTPTQGQGMQRGGPDRTLGNAAIRNAGLPQTVQSQNAPGPGWTQVFNQQGQPTGQWQPPGSPQIYS